MTEFGQMGVDWEVRIDYQRMRKERLEKAKQAIKKFNVDALILFRWENTRYLTGFRSHMWPMMNWGLITTVLPRDEEPIVYTIDEEHAKARMPWIRPENIRPRWHIETNAGARDWSRDCKGILEKLKIADGIIGVDSWCPSLYTVLPDVFNRATFVDGQEVMMDARIIKTKDEIECLKVACMITEAGMEEARHFLKAGVKECEVLAEAFRIFYRLGSEWSQCTNIVTSGPYTAPYRRFTSDRIIRNGDLVIMDIGARYNGYYGDFTRTWVCGEEKPTHEQKKLHSLAYETLRKAERAVKPGNTTWDVYKAAGEYVLGRGLGHGLGIAAYEAPFLGPAEKENPTVLKPGMVFSIEPYAGKTGVGGIRLENNVIVTETSCEVYSKYPFEEKLLEE